jgi:hypothetical protein
LSLGASSTAINVHKAVIEVELCLAPDSISEEVGSGQDSAASRQGSVQCVDWVRVVVGGGERRGKG